MLKITFTDRLVVKIAFLDRLVVKVTFIDQLVGKILLLLIGLWQSCRYCSVVCEDYLKCFAGGKLTLGIGWRYNCQ